MSQMLLQQRKNEEHMLHSSIQPDLTHDTFLYKLLKRQEEGITHF